MIAHHLLAAVYAGLLCSGAAIALDIASALAFLHDGLRVVHFDVKAAVSQVVVQAMVVQAWL